MSTNAPLSCQVVIGQLVPRPCGEKAKRSCTRCGKACCAEHTTEAGLCKHCGSNEKPPAVVMDEPFDLAFQPDDLAKFQVEQAGDPDSAWSDLT